jgi:ElaB/YqjD/DUF883 family membrane-anchored ribosome-binding protein
MTTELTGIEEKEKKLLRDIRGAVADGDHLLKQVANSSAEQFAAARTKIDVKLTDARSRLDGARIAVTETAKDAADATYEYVRENPWKLLGVAIAAGLVIGLFLRRR